MPDTARPSAPAPTPPGASPFRARIRRWRKAAFAAVTALALPAAALVAAPAPAAASIPPPPSGWSLVWGDDFDGPAGALPSAENWIIDLGHGYPGGPANWGTGEIQRYTDDPANVSLDGQGNLRITPLKTASGEWTSARIETRRADFKPAEGRILRIEGRIQMPNVTGDAALGYWPAFWALGSPYRGHYHNWPAIGEFDIMENVNGLDTVWGVLHCGVNPGGPCDESNGIGAGRACPGSACQSAMHTYRFEWDRSVTPNQLRWYVDGRLYHTVSQSRFDAGTWDAMTGHGGYFLLLNVAMGGAFPDGVAGFGTPTAATVPGHPMIVDYVAVWQSGDGGTAPTDPPPGGFDARSVIQAEDHSAQSGVQVEATTDVGGGYNVSHIADGDWIRFDDVDFGAEPVRRFQARVASGAAAGISGLVRVRLDSPTGPVLGDFAIADTGGWQSWRTVPADITPTTGRHTLYLTFESGQPADFVNLNWFTFTS